MTELNGILLDLDDTLMAEVGSARAAMLEVCRLAAERYHIDPFEMVATVFRKAKPIWHAASAREYCLRIGVSSWEGLWARFEGEGDDLAELRSFAPGYRHDVWKAALFAYGIDDSRLARELAEAFPPARRRRHVVFDDAEPLLQSLFGRFKLGLATNGLSCLQREKIAGSKLAHYFDAIVISGDIGVRKPEPAYFEHALEKLGVEAERTLMLGNSKPSDIKGAQSVGICAVYFDRDDPHGEDETVSPDYTIRKLPELLAIVGM